MEFILWVEKKTVVTLTKIINYVKYDYHILRGTQINEKTNNSDSGSERFF